MKNGKNGQMEQMHQRGDLDRAVLLAILDTLPEGLIFADRHDQVAYINPAAVAIRQIPGHRYIGLDVISIHSPRLRALIAGLLHRFRSGEQSVHQHRSRIHGRLFENSYYAIRDRQGGYLGALMVNRPAPEEAGVPTGNRALSGPGDKTPIDP